MRFLLLPLLATGLALPAFGQSHGVTDPAVSGYYTDTSSASGQQQVWHEADGRPVTLTWGQVEPETLRDYQQPFEEIDVNGDGFIAPDEVPAGHALGFEWHLLDNNNDGRISRQEYWR